MTSNSPKPEQPNIIVSGAMRRFPVYLLLDTSSSMTGAPIEAVRLGVEQFKREVEMDPQAIENVHVGVITFGGVARFITKGLVPLDKFEPPSLNVSGGTPLGQALWLLNESLDKDVEASVRGKVKGDYKPLVFILTDGQPTDEWKEALDEIRRRQNRKVVSVVTVGCGPNIDQNVLKQIAADENATFNMDGSEASFKAFFKWVSQTVTSKSKDYSESGGAEKGNIEPPPLIQPTF